MRSGAVTDVYNAADALYDIGEPAVPLLLAVVEKEKDPWVLVGCLRTLVDLEAAGRVADRLLALADVDQEPRVRIAAYDIIASLPRSRKLETTLADTLDRTYDPYVKAALAKCLFHVGSSSHRARSRDELTSLLRSENREYRIIGSLALAEIGAFEVARPVLYEIEDDPTTEGRLARSYLQIEKINRYWESRETRRLRAEKETEPTADEDDQFDLLREIMDLVVREHIYGERYEGPDGREELLTAAAKGMLAWLDRHSTYFSPEEYQKWLLDLNRHYAGIGAYVQTIGGFFTITRPIYSGPAFKAGLRSDDQILKVDGWETYNQPQQDVIDRLKAEPGTKVVVEVMRAGWKEPKTFDIVRAVISIPSVRWELFPGGVGYVEVETFGDETAGELRGALNDLTAQGAQGFILDLRYNPGGYLRQAIEMVGEFIGPDQQVVYTEGRKPAEDRSEYLTDRNARGRPEPVFVLINHRSASASEIVSGALRYHKRAKLIGVRTFGKGSVQNPFQLRTRQGEPFADRNNNGIWDPDERYNDLNKNGKFDYGAMFKLTTQRYYLPNGESIHTDIDAEGRVAKEGGIEPDIEIEFEGTEPWKQEELSDLIERDVFDKYLDEHFEANKKLFVQLAEGDDFDEARYPEFDGFYTSLETHLDRNEIRRWLRLFLRNRVSDERGKPFPGNQFLGDYEEDNQLQRAIVELLKVLGKSPESFPAYAHFADIGDDAKNKEEVRNDR